MKPTLTPQQLVRRQATGQPIPGGDAPAPRRHVIALLLEDSIGALNRVVNLFCARGFQLESVAVGPTDDETISRLTLVTSGDDRIVAQVNRQLERLIDVLVVEDLTGHEYVERELCLVKVGQTLETRGQLLDTLKIFRGRVVDVTLETMTFELTGPPAKIDAFVNLVRPHGILEIARSGRVAMARAPQETTTAVLTESDIHNTQEDL